MKPLAEYLMEHGILKNADAETMATEIEARFARERDRAQAKCAEMREALRVVNEWDDNPGEPTTKQMLEVVRDALSTDCGKPTAQPCHECREVTLPMISVTGPNVPRGTGKPRQFCSIHCFWKWIRRVEESRDEAGRLDRIHSWD